MPSCEKKFQGKFPNSFLINYNQFQDSMLLSAKYKYTASLKSDLDKDERVIHEMKWTEILSW